MAEDFSTWNTFIIAVSLLLVFLEFFWNFYMPLQWSDLLIFQIRPSFWTYLPSHLCTVSLLKDWAKTTPPGWTWHTDHQRSQTPFPGLPVILESSSGSCSQETQHWGGRGTRSHVTSDAVFKYGSTKKDNPVTSLSCKQPNMYEEVNK
jgi:hypothetical protein